MLSRKIFGFQLSAVIETLLFLIILVGWNAVFGDGKRYIDSVPHPFWIIILLMTIQYGIKEGVLAVILSILFLYVDNIPVQLPHETRFSYDIRLTWIPVLWFITAIILGMIRFSHENEKQELKEKLATVEKESDVITEAYQQIKNVKEHLEVQLAGQLKTTAATFKCFESLESRNPTQILLNLPSVIVPTLNPKKFSVYFFGPNGFEPVIAHGWEAHETYKRRFQTQDILYKTIVKNKKVLSISNPEDEIVLGNEGVLAAPLIASETHELFGMLKIEDIGVQELNIHTLEILQTLSELIGASYTNARRYKRLENQLIQSSYVPFYSQAMYKVQLRIFQTLSLPFSQIRMKFRYPKKEKKEESSYVNAVIYLLFQEILPESAMTFYEEYPENFMILLPSFSKEKAEEICNQLHEAIKKNDYLQSQHFQIEVV